MNRLPQRRAILTGLFFSGVLAALIVVGSRRLAHFDAALVAYTFATLFATFGVSYRYAMWLQRPPTRMYWRRGWQTFAHPRLLAVNLVAISRRLARDVAANRFIFKRGLHRGLAHISIMWGCIVAAAITFPLVWGWIHFETVPGSLGDYRAFLFGVPTGQFPLGSAIAFIVFHGLVWSSLLVLGGVVLAFRRRMIDHGAAALQQFGEDVLPLLLLGAISITGLLLTVSYTWMKGYAYDFLAILHAITVVMTLLWLPFGKLFHVFQRPAQIGVAIYKEAEQRADEARCRRCATPFAPAAMVRDLATVERELGFRYELAAGGAAAHYQEICPRCRRALYGMAQGALWAAENWTCHEEKLTVATIPADELDIIRSFGPHLSPGTGPHSGGDPDRLVKTHCCFCGQQCGIQLKVRGDEVIGFEPWEDFPFNRGMLCPKGVKRYLQGGHPDRLTSALRRDPTVPGGFRRISYDEAIAASAAAIARIQEQHGPSAVALLGGASLTTEKTYLLGKFARVCLRTPYIDYNGRLCMVSAGAANKKAFGIDRTTNPWSDMVGTDVIWVAGSNVAECSPITTNYIWQSREQGAKVIVQDPRITPVARTCDLYLPVRPGRDAALFAGVLNLMIENDWIDHDFIAAHTVGFESVAAYCREWTPARTAELTGVPERSIRAAAELWGTAKTSFLFHARGIEHHSNGVQNALGTINLVLASGRIGLPKCGYGTIVGQANGQGGREHGQKCDQLPGWRDISNPEHRRYIASVWGVDEPDIPGPGVDAYELFRKIDAGEIKALIAICFNPKVSLPDSQFVTRALEKLEHFTAIDFFLNDTAHHADIVLPGSLQEEDEGTVTQVEGRVIKINRAVKCPGEARQDWIIIQDLARALGRPKGFTFDSPRAIFEELRVASKGGVADYSGITYEKIEQQMGVFWPCYSTDPRTGEPTPGHPGTPRLFERGTYNPVAKGAGPFYFPDGKARFNVADYRPAVDDVSAEFPLFLTTGRVVSQFLSGTQTRRIGPLVKQYAEPRIEMHPRLAEKLGIADGVWATAETRRGAITLRAMVVSTIRPDTIFIPYHWPGEKSVNRLTVAAQDPISKIPQYKVCGCRLRKADGPPAYAARLEPQQ